MIIWLTSYPKSGNTWLRTIIGQFFDKEHNESEVFRASNEIRSYPQRSDFIDLEDVFKQETFSESIKKNVVNNTIKNWTNSQVKINLNDKINILKTHNMLCKIDLENNPYSFTDLKNTLGVIHIVRDPRNVITSLKNHFFIENNEEALDFIFRENNWIGYGQNRIPEFLSSWKNHYNSWKRFPKNYLLIKYEDLLLDSKSQIIRLRDYLCKFMNISISEEQIEKIVANTSFKNLQKQEKNNKFDENAFNISTKEKRLFFNLGPKNDWKKILDKKTSNLIVNNFKSELIELNYL
jgi:hypothetical protein